MNADEFLNHFETELDEGRWKGLHRLPSWWEKDESDWQSNWTEAIASCYRTLTEWSFNKRYDRRRWQTYGFLVPLDKSGNVPGNLFHWIQSGKDVVMPNTAAKGGRCAERKWLEENSRRKVGMLPVGVDVYGPAAGLGILQETQSLVGKPHAWLFYTTRSPCQHCSAAMVEYLRKGVYDHMVVAFENCYTRWAKGGGLDPVSKPVREFFDEVKKRRIEVFKVHRELADKEKLEESYRQRINETGSAFVRHSLDKHHSPALLKNEYFIDSLVPISPKNKAIDSTVKVIRVKEGKG